MRHVAVTALAAMLMMMASPGTVDAAPVNNPHVLEFEATCEGIGTVGFIESPSNVVAFVVGSTQRTIIHQAEYVISVVSDENVIPVAQVSETLGTEPSQKRGLADRLIECVFDVVFPVDLLGDDDWAAIEEATGIGPDDADGVHVAGNAMVMPTPGNR